MHGLCYFYDKNCIQASIKQCFLCRSGYYLNNGVCQQLPLNCLKVDPLGVCISCQNTYLLAHGLCVTPILGCKEYKFRDSISICVNCQIGFNLLNDTC